MDFGHESPKDYNFGQRLIHLMDLDGLLKESVPHRVLASRLLEGGYIELCPPGVDDKDTDKLRRGQLDNLTRIILRHLRYRSASTVDTNYIYTYCDYFGCSSDYLLGYDDSITREITDISSVTGLEDVTINVLADSKKQSDSFSKYVKDGSSWKEEDLLLLPDGKKEEYTVVRNRKFFLDAVNMSIQSPKLMDLIAKYIEFSSIESIFIGDKHFCGIQSNIDDLREFENGDPLSIPINGEVSICINGNPLFEITEEDYRRGILREIQRELDGIKDNLKKDK